MCRGQNPTQPPNITEEEKAYGLNGTRTQELWHTVQALRPLSYRVTQSTIDILYSLRNNNCYPELVYLIFILRLMLLIF